MKTLLKIPYIEKIELPSFANLPSAQVKIYGVKMNFYSKDPRLIRFIKRKFSLMNYYRLDDSKYNMTDKKLEIFVAAERKSLSMEELLYIDIDTNALISSELSDKCIFFHASCVASDKNYLIFPGSSNSGKSTISVCLSERGFSLLADDDSVLKYGAIKALPYPTIGNFRARARFLNNSIAVKKSIISHIYNISDSEFKKIYDLETYLYRPKFSGPGKKKNLNFIFIKGRRNNRPHLRIADKTNPETIRHFFRFITTQKEKRNSNISKIIDLYSKSNIYYLNMGTPDDTAELILKKFL
ncbi:MAG: hypothetical protein PHQ96_09345 [Candidatus Omnitrophica bacterium]|nr:hypothetical protein [Candidatus Omnitrophota bacterium]